MSWVFDPLKPNGYGLVLCDPPWNFAHYSRKGITKSAQAHYDCMSQVDLEALPVADLAAPDCALVMWATAPMLPQAVDLMQRWDFTFKSAGAWAKQSRTGRTWMFGTGYLFRSAAEFYIVGTRGKPRIGNRSTRNLVVAPVREHSRKPHEFHDMISALFPDGERCELFARERREGWDCWGFETDKFGGGDEQRTREDGAEDRDVSGARSDGCADRRAAESGALGESHSSADRTREAV